jgi:hypothetical protein
LAEDVPGLSGEDSRVGVGFGASGIYGVCGDVDVVDQVFDDQAGGETVGVGDDGQVFAVGVHGDAVVVHQVEQGA